MLILQTSHRKNGTTAEAAENLSKLVNTEIIHLCDFQLAHFDYTGPGADDFESLIERLISHDEVVFATPIYWYTMSGMLKVFLDRISDLLKWNKELGRKIRGMKMHVISVSGHDDPPLHFKYPFEMTAEYLGMSFGQYVHICPGQENRIRSFADGVLEK